MNTLNKEYQKDVILEALVFTPFDELLKEQYKMFRIVWKDRHILKTQNLIKHILLRIKIMYEFQERAYIKEEGSQWQK